MFSEIANLRDFKDNLDRDGKVKLGVCALDMKLFWVFKNDQEKEKRKRKKFSSGDSKYSIASEIQTEFSLREILQLPTKDLSSRIFVYDKRFTGKDLTKLQDNELNESIQQIIKNLKSMAGIEEEFIPKFKFIQFKKSYIKAKKGEARQVMLSFADISSKILYDTTKAEGEFLSLINSTISHEMRNPLNSIINQCKIMSSVAYNFLQLLKTLPQEV